MSHQQKSLFTNNYNIKEMLSVLQRQFKLFLIVFISILVLSLGYMLIKTPSYVSTTKILVEPIYNLESISGYQTSSTNINKEVQYLNNHSTIVKALQKVDLTSFYNKDGSDYSNLLTDDKKYKAFEKNLGISVGEDTKMVVLSLKHSNQEFAKSFLQALHETFDTILLDLATEQLDKEYHLLESKLEEAEDNLAKLEFARDEFQASPIAIESNSNRGSYQRILSFIDVRIREVELFSKGTNIPNVLESFKLQDSTTAGHIEAYRKAYRKLLFYEITQLVNPTKANEIESKDYYMTFYRDNLESQKTVLSDHVRSLRRGADIESMLLQITSTLEYSILTDEKQYYLGKVQEYKATDVVGEKINFDLSQYKNKQIQYTNDIKSFEEFRSISVAPTYIVDPIRIVDKKGDTNRKLILALGLYLGLVLGLLVAFLNEYFSESFNEEMALRRLIDNKIDFWGFIPSSRNKNNLNSEIIVPYETNNRISRAFNQLAGIIQYGVGSKESPIYSFSSLGYEEATVDTVLNLALSLSRSGKKVLVVGMNSIETNYQDVYSRIITSDSVAKTVSLNTSEFDLVKKSNLTITLLHLSSIDSESQELSVYVNSDEFIDIIQSARATYDFVLIDGPTFKSPSNLLAIAKVSGGLVLNMRQGIASKKAFQELIETTYYAQVPIRGIVFNAMFGMPSFKEKRRIRKQNLS